MGARLRWRRLIATGADLSYEPPRAIDLNGDGIDDVMIPRVSPAAAGTMQGLISLGHGAFAGISMGTVRTSIQTIMTGDATGDGVPDVVLTGFGYGTESDGRNFAYSTVLLIEGRQDGGGGVSFVPVREIHRETTYNAEPRFFLLGIGDTNGDGRPDIVIERANIFYDAPSTATLLLVEEDDAATDGFSARTPIPDRNDGDVFGPIGYSTGDVDGDGVLEVFGAGAGGAEGVVDERAGLSDGGAGWLRAGEGGVVGVSLFERPLSRPIERGGVAGVQRWLTAAGRAAEALG